MRLHVPRSESIADEFFLARRLCPEVRVHMVFDKVHERAVVALGQAVDFHSVKVVSAVHDAWRGIGRPTQGIGPISVPAYVRTSLRTIVGVGASPRGAAEYFATAVGRILDEKHGLDAVNGLAPHEHLSLLERRGRGNNRDLHIRLRTGGHIGGVCRRDIGAEHRLAGAAVVPAEDSPSRIRRDGLGLRRINPERRMPYHAGLWGGKLKVADIALSGGHQNPRPARAYDAVQLTVQESIGIYDAQLAIAGYRRARLEDEVAHRRLAFRNRERRAAPDRQPIQQDRAGAGGFVAAYLQSAALDDESAGV